MRDEVDVRLCGCGDRAHLLDERHDPLHAHRKADRRRGIATELRDQAVVTTARAHGILRTERVGDPLEHGARVVVETADQPRVDCVRNADRIEQSAKAFEVRTRRLVEIVGEQWSTGDQRLHCRVLAVEDAQRVTLEPALTVSIERVVMCAKVLGQPRPIFATRLRSTERVELQAHAADAQAAPERRRECDEFRIDVRALEADGLDVDLMKLAETALLRFFVPEHRPDAPHLVASTAQHAVGDDRTDHASGRLGTQGQTFSTLVLEAVHLLLNDVRVLTDGTLEKVRLLDHRYAHLVETIGVQQLASRRFEELPAPDLGRQHVVHALDGLDGLDARHGQ